MKKVYITTLVLMIALTTGCYSTSDIKEVKEDSYNNGYSDGYNAGLEAGYVNGYDVAYYDGYSEGHKEGRWEGLTKAWDENMDSYIENMAEMYVRDEEFKKYFDDVCKDMQDYYG